MTCCLAQPTDEVRQAVAILDLASNLVLLADLQAARDAVDSIDEVPLRLRWASKSHRRDEAGFKRFQKGSGSESGGASRVRASVKRAVYRRDGWRCRYCEIEVVAPEARSQLVKMLTPLGSESLWGTGDSDRHAALLNLSASYDHVAARSESGSDEMENLVTACYFCQFGKGAASLELLGLQDPRERGPICDSWDGLLRLT